MNQATLKAELLRRADRRKAYACHGARAYAVAHFGGGWNREDRDGARWVETLEGAGLRLAGYSDALARLGHTGWYCDTFQDDTYRGAVLQLASRRGRRVFLAAYQESANDGFRVDTRGGTYDDETDAAHAADGFARHWAEEARAYDEAWQAGARYGELGENIKEDRRAALALAREIRAAGKSFAPAICSTLRMRLEQLRRRIAEYRAERRALLDAGAWWVRAYGAAFNDGAGEVVFAG